MKTQRWTPWLFLAPNLFGFFAFTLLPIVSGLFLAFCKWDFFSPPEFVGFANFHWLIRSSIDGPLLAPAIVGGVSALVLLLALRRSGGGFRGNRWLRRIAACGVIVAGMLLIPELKVANPRFWQSVYNTLFLMLGLPVTMAGSLLLAILLNDKIYANRFFRLAYFLPSIVGGVGVYLLWKWIFNPDYGVLNQFLALFGLEGPKWLEAFSWAKPALLLMQFWGSVGGTNMILYLAALQNISPELYEAAAIDGAGRWHRFRNIVIPMVSSTSFFILVMGIIHGFQGGFDAAYVMTRGGPAASTTTLSYFIYEQGFQYFQMGRASAASWVLFMMVLIFTWLNWRFGSSRVHYA